MGQVALGLRSLAVKAAIFFVLCALLVWALGGQLFPAPEIVDGEAVQFAGSDWFWRLYAGGDEPGAMHWMLMQQRDNDVEPVTPMHWRVVAGPIVASDGLYYAGDATGSGEWQIDRRTADGETQSWTLPDRLAVEQQLERLQHGLPLQDVGTIQTQRPAVLDPAVGSADERLEREPGELTELAPADPSHS